MSTSAYPLAPNLLNTLRLPDRFILDLHIDPDSDHAQKCVYSLLNEDGSVHQRRTPADDAIPGDDKLTLVFTGLSKGLRYTLEVDDGDDGSYYLFYHVPLKRLLEIDADPQGTDEGPGDQDHPEDYDSLEFDTTLPDFSDDDRQPPDCTYQEIAEEHVAADGAGQIVV